MTDSDQPTARGVRIESHLGGASITLDGNDVSGHVVAYRLEHSVQETVPTLLLHTREPDSVVWEGVARVALADPQNAGDTTALFLQGIDPAALQRAALDRPDLDGSRTGVTEAILRQLADWAQGRT
ncbi:hypothetical protein [Streptomyces sp. NPDC059916]|uniref:hypothetical protein n=1 Tax=Streptomyces sp. NPDC059916 TaxID=3347001 RepID=UPI0036ADAA38